MILGVIVFISGAAVMILEIMGSRILAPYLGTSIFVWTSLIGVILGSLSLGYFWGGRLADKNPSFKILSLLLLLAAFSVALLGTTKSSLLELIQNNTSSLRAASFFSALVLLGPPSILLGAVLPYSTRLKLRSLAHAGSTVGSLYAISTAGSILGTFLAGFLLIPYLGMGKIISVLFFSLLFISALAYFKNPGRKTLFLASIILLLSSPLLLIPEEKLALVDTNSQYNRILVYRSLDQDSGRATLELVTGSRIFSQSAMFLDNKEELVPLYLKFFDLAGYFNPNIKKALMLGGGAYSYPKHFLKLNPEAVMDVVEIDPRLTQIAREYFGLENHPRLRIYHQDGRAFLNQNSQLYDAIFIDVFKSFFDVPYHLTTKEAVEKIYDSLSQNGVVTLNIVSSINGKTGKFLQAEYETYKSLFPQVFVLPVSDPSDGEKIQNIIIVALKSGSPSSFPGTEEELEDYFGHLWTKNIPEAELILKDEYAPLDLYFLEMLEKLAKM